VEKFEIREVKILYGSKDGKSTTAGCTRQPFSIATSGASLASGLVGITNAPFLLFGAFTSCDAEISSGVSVILGHAGGLAYDVEISSRNMSSENYVSWIPDAPLLIPSGCSVMLRSEAPKVTGSTRYHSLIVGY
jgi:hypothetical protein